MLKRLVLAAAAGAALATAGTPALAHGSFAFEDPYWQQQLVRSGEANVFGPFAAAPRGTMTDARGEARAAEAGLAAAIEAEKARLDRAGFPQYTQ